MTFGGGGGGGGVDSVTLISEDLYIPPTPARGQPRSPGGGGTGGSPPRSPRRWDPAEPRAPAAGPRSPGRPAGLPRAVALEERVRELEAQLRRLGAAGPGRDSDSDHPAAAAATSGGGGGSGGRSARGSPAGGGTPRACGGAGRRRQGPRARTRRSGGAVWARDGTGVERLLRPADAADRGTEIGWGTETEMGWGVVGLGGGAITRTPSPLTHNASFNLECQAAAAAHPSQGPRRARDSDPAARDSDSE